MVERLVQSKLEKTNYLWYKQMTIFTFLIANSEKLYQHSWMEYGISNRGLFSYYGV